MNELLKVCINDNQEPVISGRMLHEFLEVKTAYKDWFPRMCEYGFVEGQDFNPLKNEQVRFEGNREVVREITDHIIRIDMAKEVSMIQRTEKGKQARQYFIEVEKKFKATPALPDFTNPVIAARAWADAVEGKQIAKADIIDNDYP